MASLEVALHHISSFGCRVISFLLSDVRPNSFSILALGALVCQVTSIIYKFKGMNLRAVYNTHSLSGRNPSSEDFRIIVRAIYCLVASCGF
jgi:hypothetical protein